MSRVPTPIRRLMHVGLLAVCALVGLSTSAWAAGPNVVATSPGRSPIAGMQDELLPTASSPVARMRLIAETGATLTRVGLLWNTVAIRRPADPANPADPAYDWHQYDAIVSAAATYNLEVLFTVYGTPTWAQDSSVKVLPGYEPRFPDSALRPTNPADFGAFGEAAAKRYSPLGVHKWEGWNEPNIALYLQPQYELVGGRWRQSSPATYAALLKAFSAGVKRVDPTAVVAGAVTAPAGDLGAATRPVSQPPLRITPPEFVRALNAPSLRPPMDVVSHHPYPLSAPRTATAPGRSYVDLYNMNVLLAAIDSTYLKAEPIWLTEYGFATRAVVEYPIFFTKAQQAAFISDAYWRTRANPRIAMTVYYLLQDHPGWASGVLTEAGLAKPGYQALGLPFATATGNTSFAPGSRVTLVGQSRLGRGAVRTVEIQRRSGSRWVRLTRVTTGLDGSFRVRLRLTSRVSVRAKWTGVAPSGATTSRTSPPVTLTIRR